MTLLIEDWRVIVDCAPYYRLIVVGLEEGTREFLVTSGKCATAPVVWEGADPLGMPVSSKDTFLGHLPLSTRSKVVFKWQDRIDGIWGDCPDPLVKPY